jgi:hypothetical protein
VPTVTKPKRPIDPRITPVNIPAKLRRNLAESAGLDHRSRSGKDFLARAERVLTWHHAMLERVPQRSLPAHTIAALKPIARQAAALAPLLNPSNLPIEVLAELTGADIDGAYTALIRLAYEAERGIKRLAGQASRGQYRRALQVAMESAMSDLRTLFRDHAHHGCDEDDCAEFLERCEKCLKT